ncbi:hypothetical protein RYX36_029423 [Vicia faba]
MGKNLFFFSFSFWFVWYNVGAGQKNSKGIIGDLGESAHSLNFEGVVDRREVEDGVDLSGENPCFLCKFDVFDSDFGDHKIKEVLDAEEIRIGGEKLIAQSRARVPLGVINNNVSTVLSGVLNAALLISRKRKVCRENRLYQIPEFPQIAKKKILCIGANNKQHVLKWESNMAWPVKLTLTDKAIYFEAIGLLGNKKVIRLDITYDELKGEKAKVGPLGSSLFDSLFLFLPPQSEPNWWVLELIDLRGEMRKDIWNALISEVIALHKFIHEHGPEDSDESLFNVYGACIGKQRATTSAINDYGKIINGFDREFSNLAGSTIHEDNALWSLEYDSDGNVKTHIVKCPFVQVLFRE